jgi:hypothetical protein
MLQIVFQENSKKNDNNAVLAFETTTQFGKKFFDIFMYKKFKFNFI